MLPADERAEVVATCRALRRDRLVVGTAGNVSVRAGELVPEETVAVADRIARA